jgi:hypothetical protein
LAADAIMVMVPEVEVATQSSLDSDASGAANEVDNGAGAPGEVAVPPSSPEAGGGAALMVAEDEAAAAALDEAAALVEGYHV